MMAPAVLDRIEFLLESGFLHGGTVNEKSIRTHAIPQVIQDSGVNALLNSKDMKAKGYEILSDMMEDLVRQEQTRTKTISLDKLPEVESLTDELAGEVVALVGYYLRVAILDSMLTKLDDSRPACSFQDAVDDARDVWKKGRVSDYLKRVAALGRN